MISTKTEILSLLKRSGVQSVSELAAGVQVAPVTARQHLTHLERDGLVAVEQRAGGNGRPAFVFRLTAKGHASGFPRRTDRMMGLLVREVGSLEGGDLNGLRPGEKVSLVLRRVAERMADEFAPLLRGWALEQRVAFITEVMHADGGLAEWEATDAGYEIRDFNCLFHNLPGNQGEVCEWHRTFVSRALGTDVRVVPCEEDGGGRCCRYIIETAAT